MVCNEEGLGSITGLGRSPGGGHGNPLQCSCLENPHRQRSLAGCSPWGHKEWNMTEQLSTAHSTARARRGVAGAAPHAWNGGRDPECDRATGQKGLTSATSGLLRQERNVYSSYLCHCYLGVFVTAGKPAPWLIYTGIISILQRRKLKFKFTVLKEPA